MTIDEIAALAPVIPVLVIDDIAHARAARPAPGGGGLPVLEITLRTPIAMQWHRAHGRRDTRARWSARARC